MNPHDIETRLDDALSRWRNDPGAAEPVQDAPDLIDQIRVAQRLQALLPTPVPNLSVGRRRFLDQASRVQSARGWPDRPVGWLRTRPAVAVLSAVATLLVVGGAVGFAAGSILSGMGSTPIWDSTTPTTSPTYEATPNHNSLAPTRSTAMLTTRMQLPQPLPMPAPDAAPASRFQ